jgi:hypothetical protein
MSRSKLVLLYVGLLATLFLLPHPAPRRAAGFVTVRSTSPLSQINELIYRVKSKAYHDDNDSLGTLCKALMSVAVLDEPVTDGQSLCGKPTPDNLTRLVSPLPIRALCRLLI